MAREFPAEVSALTQRREQARLYRAAFQITLPIGPGEIQRPVLRVAEADTFLPSLVTLDDLIFAAFNGALKRDPSVAEYDDWRAQLDAAKALGPQQVADAAGPLVGGLFAGAEYAARATTDDQYVLDLYQAYADRDPEVGGRAFWLGELAANGRAALSLAWQVSIEFGDRARSADAPQRYYPHVVEGGGLSPVVLNEGSASDDVTVELQNLGDAYSKYLAEGDRLLHPAPVVAMRAYPVGADGWWCDVLFPGFAKFTDVGRRSAKLTISSDFSREGAKVGSVEADICLLQYKGPGCDTNDPSPTCSRLYDGANGCGTKQPAPVLINGHGGSNRPSFGGSARRAAELAGAVPAVTTRPPNTEGGGGGFGGGGGIDPEDPRLGPARPGLHQLVY